MTQRVLPDSATLPAAGLDRRFYAFVLDRLLFWSIYAVVSYGAYVRLIEPGGLEAGLGLIAGVVVFLGLVSSVVLGLTGSSPGKALVGLRVVRLETGSRIGVGRALLRNLILGIAALPTVGIGVATLAWTSVMDGSGRRRGWHDHVAHAVVVDIRPEPVVEVSDTPAPRQIVNLTAMRLIPAPRTPPVVTPERAPKPRGPKPTIPPLGLRSRTPPVAPPPAAGPAATRAPVAQLGPPLVDPARPPVAGPRWRVSFDTGESLMVEGLALVGRRPEARSGEQVSHLVALRSSDMSLSKTHAQFQVVAAGDLVVMDRGSTNGSVLIRRGVAKPLNPGRPATLVEGDQVRFGDRMMTVMLEEIKA